LNIISFIFNTLYKLYGIVFLEDMDGTIGHIYMYRMNHDFGSEFWSVFKGKPTIIHNLYTLMRVAKQYPEEVRLNIVVLTLTLSEVHELCHWALEGDETGHKDGWRNTLVGLVLEDGFGKINPFETRT
jgi:hypothetical protein